jgi:hypothetical protein
LIAPRFHSVAAGWATIIIFLYLVKKQDKERKKDFHCGFMKVCSIYTVADRLRKEINQYSNKKVK